MLLTGRLPNPRLVLEVEIGREGGTTIDGLPDSVQLHPLQRTFLDNAAIQCCLAGVPIGQGGTIDERKRHQNPGVETIGWWYDRVMEAVGPCNIQISGGEPVGLHRNELDSALFAETSGLSHRTSRESNAPLSGNEAVKHDLLHFLDAFEKAA
jgi:hypothetical protein